MVKSKQYKNNRWRVWRLAAYFRVLLWWGAEQMRNIRKQFSPPIPVEQRIKMDLSFPQSDWIFEDDHGYCLIGVSEKREYQIIELYPMSQN